MVPHILSQKAQRNVYYWNKCYSCYRYHWIKYTRTSDIYKHISWNQISCDWMNRALFNRALIISHEWNPPHDSCLCVVTRHSVSCKRDTIITELFKSSVFSLCNVCNWDTRRSSVYHYQLQPIFFLKTSSVDTDIYSE